MSRSARTLLVASFVAAATSSQASVIFQNTGNTSGWGHILKDSGCSMTVVSSPTFKGSQAIRHYAKFSGSGDRSVHCEVARDPAFSVGEERYYGWAFRLGSDFPSSHPVASVLAQFGTRTPGCPWQQIDFFQIKGTSFQDATGYGDGCNPSGRTHTIGGIPSRNVWHRIIIRKIWREDSSGLLEIWLDGTKKVSSRQPTTFKNTSTSRNWHVGLYAGFTPGQAGSRTVWTDQARHATTYGEANPDAW
jgi:hypothetical protein